MIKTSAEWAKEYNDKIEILTFDGWPEYPADFNSVPVSRQEFLECAAAGVVRFLDNPSRVFEGVFDAA